MNKVIKLALMGTFAAVYFNTFAVDVVTTASANVAWNASAIKKSEVDLNIFANNDSLQFKYDPANARFSNVGSSLTVQAGGKAGATAYSITAQLLRSTLTHLSGKSAGTLNVSSTVGGIAMDKMPVNILKGIKGKIELSAAGLQAMDLSSVGLAGVGANKFNEGIVPVDFRIEEGTVGTQKYTLGDPTNGLDKLADGNYEGTVELAFVASWTAPDAALPATI